MSSKNSEPDLQYIQAVPHPGAEECIFIRGMECEFIYDAINLVATI